LPARTDHDRRDAQHAARATIAIAMGRYVRRITEEAYAHIEQAATEATEDDIDWSHVGAASAYRALAHYGVAGTATAAVDAADVAELDPAAGDIPARS
jgi:hypothetical protein